MADAKTGPPDICHGVKPEFLLENSNEFRHKFNRRRFGERLF